MSILKKNALALAIVAAAGFATTAGAYTIRTAGDTTPEGIARQAGTTVTMTQQVNAQIELGDALIGRTTGFQARITLLDGARFNTALTSGSITLGAAAVGTWSSTLAAGGAVNGTVAQFQISPSVAGDTITSGQLFELAALNLNQVSTTGNTRIRIELIDPVTGLTIAGAVNNAPGNNFDQERIIISRPNGLDVACVEQVNADRIDVAGDIADGNPAPGAAFVAFPWTIGGPFVGGNNLVPANNFSSRGTVTWTTSNGFGLVNADTISIRLTGTNFANLSFYAVPAASTCAAANSVGSFTLSPATPAVQNIATFNNSVLAINTAQPGTITTGSPSTGSLRICAQGNGSAILAQSITGEAGINAVYESTSCPVAALQRNGSTVNIANVPPAGNATQEGLIRIVNNSTLSGRVTIRGRDDAGTLTSLSLTLPAGRSVVYTTAELESGTAASATPTKPALTGALGDGAGRWRLNIVGEFDNMQVQAYARNVNNDALSNITDFESNAEQNTERKNLNFD